MEKRTTKIYITIFILALIGVSFALPFLKADVYSRTQVQVAQLWNDKMEQFKEGDSFVYKMILPMEDMDNKVIGYDSAHMQIEVTIDNNVVYSLSAKGGYLSKTPGYYWNFISFTHADKGKEIVFRVTPVYKDSKPKGNFYFGTRSSVEHLIVKEHLPRFVIAVAILLVGIILFFYVVFILKKVQQKEPLFHFTLFAIMLGIWYMSETQLLEMFLPCHVGLLYMDHMMLMLMPIPFLLFLQQIYQSKSHFLWSFICYSNCIVVALRILLQLFDIADLRETLLFTHIMIALSVIIVVFLSIYEIVKYKLTGQVKLNISCVLIILVTIILELLEYRVNNKSTPYGSLGFLFYIIVMAIESVRNSRKVIEQAKESELYRKLAFTDELTKLYNRTAFNKDINERFIKVEIEYKIVPTVLFMFDLNDLKKCNDNFGHEYGDCYITMVSDIIKEVFGTDGKCYRIGGDEFCSIMDYTSQEDIENKYNHFVEAIQKKNEQEFVVPVSVAVGYAIYDPNIDKSLEETLKRADAMMYQNKQKIKQIYKK